MKSKPAELFFQNPMGLSAWKKGKSLFEEARVQMTTVPDGSYTAMLADAKFVTPRKGRALFVFIFELVNSSVVKKAIAVESAEGVASLLIELDRLGIQISNPIDLNDACAKIRKRRMILTVSISTSGEGRYVRIEDVSGALALSKKDKMVLVKALNDPPEPAPALKEAFAETQASQEPPPDSIEPPQQAESAAPPAEEEPGEVDIQPGNRIGFVLKGKEVHGVVDRIFEEDRELAVVLDDGEKVIIAAENVVALLG